MYGVVHKSLFLLSGMFICVYFIFVQRNISNLLQRLRKKMRDEITKKGRNVVTGNFRTCSFFVVLLGGCIKDVESWACEEARNAYNVGVWNVDGAGFNINVHVGIIHWRNPSGCSLLQMSTRNISWGGECDRCVGLTTLPLSRADCLEIWWPQPPGTLRPCPGLYRVCFTFTSGSLACIFLVT